MRIANRMVSLRRAKQKKNHPTRRLVKEVQKSLVHGVLPPLTNVALIMQCFSSLSCFILSLPS